MKELRIPSVARGEPVTIRVDGREITAYRGETVHAAMLAAGCRILRHSKTGVEHRGIFCGMGICYDCLVTIDGHENRRACMQLVEEGMEIRTE
jgi:sarcosine oxidase subunit alpha